MIYQGFKDLVDLTTSLPNASDLNIFLLVLAVPSGNYPVWIRPCEARALHGLELYKKSKLGA